MNRNFSTALCQIGSQPVQANSSRILLNSHQGTTGVASSKAIGRRCPLLSGSHWLLAGDEADIIYRWPVVVITFVMALAVLLWFRHLPRQHYAEEQLQEALSNQATRATN